MGVSRRTILKYGLGGARLLALGGAGLAMRPTKMTTPQRELLLLSPTEYSILVAAASAMLDGVEGFPSARETQIAETVDEALYSCHPGVQKEFVQLLGLLESALAGFILAGRATPFSMLPIGDRRKVLESWRAARMPLFRTGFKALQGLITASYYNLPQVHQCVGYPGVPAWLTAVRNAGLESQP